MNRGYVKVWRKIEDSGLIQLPNTLALFMHILLSATHKDKKVGTSTGVVELKRGQYISGRIELARKLKQSEREIRTSLSRLHDLGIISIETTNRYSVYTIENYALYQDIDQHSDQQSTNKRPADDQQTTTKQTLKNLSIKEKTYSALDSLVAEGVPHKLAKSWLSVRSKKRMPLTEEALDATKREAIKAGLSLEEVVQKCCEKSWAGFEASYLKPKAQDAPHKETIHEKRSKTARQMFGDLANGNERGTIIDVSPEHYSASHRPALLENGEPVRETLD